MFNFKEPKSKDDLKLTFTVSIIGMVIGYSIFILPTIISDGIISISTKKTLVEGAGLFSGLFDTFYDNPLFVLVVLIIAFNIIIWSFAITFLGTYGIISLFIKKKKQESESEEVKFIEVK